MDEIKTREIEWFMRDESWTFIVHVDGTKYAIFVSPATRREVLQDVGLMAANRYLNFSWDDAAEVTQLIRELVPLPMVEPAVEPPVEPPDDVGVVLSILLPGAVFWLAVGWIIWRVLR